MGPEVKWFVDDEEVKPTDDYDIKVENDVSTLTFSEIYSDDEGDYKVQLSNKSGTCVSSAYITVKPLETTQDEQEIETQQPKEEDLIPVFEETIQFEMKQPQKIKTEDVQEKTDKPEEKVIEEIRESVEVEIPQKVEPVEEDVQVPSFKETVEVEFEKPKENKVPVFEETIQFETKAPQKVETSTEEIEI